ncbi:MAG: glycosyltransferase [Bacteroidota bacterium]
MKVLHVIDKMDPKKGGVCQAVRTMAKGLEVFGVQNEVVSVDNPRSSFLKQDTLQIHALGPAENVWSHSSRLYPWMVANLDRFQVVISHGLWQYPGYCVIRALKKLWGRTSMTRQMNGKEIRFFVMPHGMLDPYFQKAPDRKLKAIRNHLYWKIVESMVVHRADAILFTAEKERLLAKTPFRPYQPKKELVIGLGVEEPPHFSASMKEAFLARCPQVKNNPYLLFLGRIHQKKGLDFLIQAYGLLLERSAMASSKLVKKLPQLVIAGPGEESPFGQNLKRLIAANNLKQHVFFPGMLKDKAKWGAFYGAEAVLLPSHQENFGIGVVEALACGIPVLISNQVNIWKEINGAKGGLVAKDSLSGVLELLNHWMSTPLNERKTMGHNARQVFERHFAMEKASQTLLDAISD